MKKVIKLPAPNYFGDCPKCRQNNGYLNIGREHWFICRKHRVKWYVGSNIFPGWRTETERAWKQNTLLLANFMEIEPLQQYRPAEDCRVHLNASQKAEVVSMGIYRK